MAGRIQSEATITTANQLFWSMLGSANSKPSRFSHLQRCKMSWLIGIDPGETTGLVIKDLDNKFHNYQLETKKVVDGAGEILTTIKRHVPFEIGLVICEDYKVYSWKADSHSFATLHTPQLIGALQYAIITNEFHEIVFQMAQQGKGFATDEMLQKWGLYERGLKHGRDALRHIIQFMFFGSFPNVG